MIFIACSTELGIEILHLDLGDFAQLRLRHLPAKPRAGVCDPLPILAAFLSRNDAGGVFISKVKERSA